jgi:hypothetical protein
LLEILREGVEDAQVREREKQTTQRNWNAFTDSLEETLGVLSGNTATVTKELLGALVRFQTFTRDSAMLVTEQLSVLEGDIRGVKEQVWQVRLDLDAFGTAEMSAVEKLADASQERLFMVET